MNVSNIWYRTAICNVILSYMGNVLHYICLLATKGIRSVAVVKQGSKIAI